MDQAPPTDEMPRRRRRTVQPPSKTTLLLWRLSEIAWMILPVIPLLILYYSANYGILAADPFPPSTRETGDWSMRLLAIGLFVTPVARITKQNRLIRWRRIIGIWAAVYALIHFGIWLTDLEYDWGVVTHEILGKTFLAIGFVATVPLVPLAATSCNAAIRWMTGRRWRLLHRLTYGVVLLTLIHWLLAGRGHYDEFLILTGLSSLAMVWRFYRWGRDALR